MNKKVSLGVAITIVILAIALTVSCTMMLSMKYFSSMVSDVSQRQAMYDYMDEIDISVRQYYTIDEEKLRATLAQGYVAGLGDPYAEYLTADAYKKVQSCLAGNRTGFGVSVTVSKDNELIISMVDDNSPAALSGIEKRDVLTAVDNEAVTGASYSAVVSKLSSAEKILLSVRHGEASSAVELTANTYTAVSVTGRILKDTIGYMAISDFNSLTPLQFKNLYNQLTQQNAQTFIFDIRNNVGGSLDAVKEMLDYLLPRGPYAVCETKSAKETYTAEDTYEMTAHTVILINDNTAGEAEFFAAALQATGKSSLVGTSTRGKAVAQRYFSIDSDKAAVRLSIGKLSLIQKDYTWADTGLYPDYLCDLPYDQQRYFDILTDDEDTQLQQAIDVLQKSHVVPLTEESKSVKVSTASTAASSTASR